ncbi:hypothetical protein OWV82_007021 [Melia azedarach]|uniref:Uncharacterized protein n=1 Tax=Melia azedarach TaxID=155640 RepID=A0ACC1YKX0_MELAZ|nr:hypothetical protein OWV82_007021 [Melia azedarach]
MDGSIEELNIIKDIRKNIKVMKKGFINPKFKDLSGVKLSADPTNPLIFGEEDLGTASGIASEVTGTNPEINQQEGTSQVSMDFHTLVSEIHRISRLMGVLIEIAHVGDLKSRAARLGRHPTETELEFYLGAVGLTNQITVASKIRSIISALEKVCEKLQNDQTASTDNSRMIVEKIQVLNTKIDNLPAMLQSVVQSDGAQTREMLIEMKKINMGD